VHRRILHRVNHALERWFPEQRLFLKSDTSTRFVRLTPLTQTVTLGAASLVFGWSVIASSILLIDHLSSGNARSQATRAETAFEARLDALSHERDARAEEASAAQNRFQTALQQVSQMQSTLLASEERRRELETGISVIQATLRRAMTERDSARADLVKASGAGPVAPGASDADKAKDLAATLQVMTSALGDTATERDAKEADADAARQEASQVSLEMKLLEQRNDEIFTTLEGAVNISMAPLDKVFKSAGVDPDRIISEVRRGYSGQGGPLTPISFSAMGVPAIDSAEARASGILEQLDRMNMYRIATERLPLHMPLHTAFRFSSPFGYRWGRLHAGVDLAGAMGSPVEVTADGVVVFAGQQSGYGNVVKVKHDFGLETVYGHLSKIRATVGQKVSRGDRIGDMGNTGRSTGTHLHYEVHVDGKPVNPMTFIKAANDVF
jgi:murein DD-endopeptidase MepM/ murein hydrolase activator NlpD